MMVALQIVRLEQTTPGAWIAVDYALRLLGLTVLFVVTPAREIAFKREPLLARPEVALAWIAGLVLLHLVVFRELSIWLDAGLDDTKLDHRPMPHGALFWLDVTLRLVLVAIHEEILFRRVARAVLNPLVGNGWWMIAISSIAFGLIHWPHGIGDVAAATLFGVVAMLMYKRLGSLVPVMIAHYVVNALLT
jgi:membrane protease YdiL (CAAX protease family)